MDTPRKHELMKWLFSTQWWKEIESNVHDYLDIKEDLSQNVKYAMSDDEIADMISDAGGTG